MAKQSIVLDSNIWDYYFIPEENIEDVNEAFEKFVENQECILALDDNDKIMDEYRNKLSRGRNQNVGREFEMAIKRLHSQDRVSYHESYLTEEQVNELKDNTFHEPEDHIFVGTAVHADKIIVTEDGDYGVPGGTGEGEHKKAYEYMKQNLRLSVYSAKMFVQLGI